MVEANAPTLLHQFQVWERERPDAIYLTQPFPDGSVVDYSWAEVGLQARCMAAYLRSLRLPAGSSIAILGKNSAHWIIADLAIMMAGHVSVPMYPTLGAETARYILDHSEARLLFVGKLDGSSDNWPQIEKMLPPDLPLLGLPMTPRADIPQWDDLVARHAPLQPVHDAMPEELCSIIYTSGSTGQPKGVMHNYRSMMAPGPAFTEMIVITREDRLLSYLPLAHAAERAIVESSSLYVGLHMYFCNNMDSFVHDIRRARPTIFFSVPRLWTKFQQGVNAKLSPSKQRRLFALPLVSRLVKRKILRGLGLDQVRVAITGSAPLAADIIAWYRRLGLTLLEGYGMSENLAVSHSCRPGDVRIGYVGTCLRGVQARIAPTGEVLVRSPGQMMGYYKRPELTAQVMLPDGFFCTGDRGEIDADGRLRITGRVKDLFKTARGKYVAPALIENELGNHPKLESACVTGPGQPQPFALLRLAPEVQQVVDADPGLRNTLDAELAALLEQVNANVEHHEQLGYAVVVKDSWTTENGLLTPTLKIKRQAIEDRYLDNAGAWLAMDQKVIWEK
ncbi:MULTISPECIES: AMP-binding protein [Rhodanobacter]|uniref:AMP-binding protein n=1 Tax=Rhodanobacter TaxID=75309 RepID=UPI0004246669|nr:MULTISPECIES: AMP-binding protein [Rhodanobacter]TAN18858.1 MAG: AMP-binding acetyl-CoA synthetase [Rhodanobacter sp.]UJJ53994.1 AMP-binding protein [Rhodanobacter thiooxydans]